MLFTDEFQFQLYWADGRQSELHRVCLWVADINVVRVPHGGCGVMVWASISYGQRTQLHFIDGNLNARNEILRPIYRHHLRLQHDNARRPHVARICTQFLEAENVSVLPWPAYSPDMSPIKPVWDALDQHIQQGISVPANINQLCT